MKIIKNTLFPFKGYNAINIFGIVFIRKEINITQRLLRHEAIHTAQMKEMAYVFFYLWYAVEYLIKLIFRKGNAYRSISFEREAYACESIVKYQRKSFSWIKYI